MQGDMLVVNIGDRIVADGEIVGDGQFVAITAAVPIFQEWFDLTSLSHPQDYLVIAAATGLWAIVTLTLTL